MTMIIRSTFAEGLEEELPSSLPQGFPYFCIDTKRIYIGQGDNIPPKAASSEHEEFLMSFTQKLRDDVNHLQQHHEDIGSTPIRLDERGDGKLLYYDEVNNEYRFIDPINVIGNGEQSIDNNQITLLNIKASKERPYHLYIDIPETLNYNRRPVEILKLIEAQSNVTTTLMEFNESSASMFEDNPYLQFTEEGLQLNRKYKNDMKIVSESNNEYIKKSNPIDLNEFKHIHQITLDNEDSDTLFLIEDDGYCYTFEDNEWIKIQTGNPTSIDFETHGMSSIDFLTDPHTISRVTMQKEEELETGYIYKAKINMKNLKNITSIKLKDKE